MDRKTAPPFHALGDFTLPKPERFNVGTGKPSILYLPYNQIPVVKIEFVFPAGKFYEPNPGLAQFTVNLLDKGTRSRNAKEIANLFDFYGAHLELSTDSDYAYVSLYSLSNHVKLLLPLVIEILTEPTFNDDELNKYRQIFIENLKVNQEKNSYVASVALKKAIFTNHPYGRVTEINDALKITGQEIIGFHKENFKVTNVFIIGTISHSELGLISNFCEGIDIPNQNPTSFFERPNPTIQYIDGPGKDQASVRFGKFTLNRANKEIGSLTLLNHLLGGFFGSRLMKNIREEKGLTYGIYSSVSHFKQASLFTIGAEVNVQNTEEARIEIMKELDALNNISKEELIIAQNHLIGSMQNDNASIFSIVERLKVIELSKLEDTYYSRLSREIRECTTENIIEVAQVHLQNSSLTAIIVK